MSVKAIVPLYDMLLHVMRSPLTMLHRWIARRCAAGPRPLSRRSWGSRWPPTVNAVEQSPLRRRIDWSPDAV